MDRYKTKFKNWLFKFFGKQIRDLFIENFPFNPNNFTLGYGIEFIPLQGKVFIPFTEHRLKSRYSNYHHKDNLIERAKGRIMDTVMDYADQAITLDVRETFSGEPGTMVTGTLIIGVTEEQKQTIIKQGLK